jgi:hypothetical protein
VGAGSAATPRFPAAFPVRQGSMVLCHKPYGPAQNCCHTAWDSLQKVHKADPSHSSSRDLQAAQAAAEAAAAAAVPKPRPSAEALERVRARQEITQLRQQAALQEARRAAAAQRERKQRLKQQVRLQGAHELNAGRNGAARPPEYGLLNSSTHAAPLSNEMLLYSARSALAR